MRISRPRRARRLLVKSRRVKTACLAPFRLIRSFFLFSFFLGGGFSVPFPASAAFRPLPPLRSVPCPRSSGLHGQELLKDLNKQRAVCMTRIDGWAELNNFSFTEGMPS